MNEMHSQRIAKLITLQPASQSAEYMLIKDMYTVGRASICQIVVRGNDLISRMHMRIELDGARYVLHDMNSANGTFVNNRRIFAPHLLRDGDLIGMGSPLPIFQFCDPDATTLDSMRLLYDENTRTFQLDNQQVALTRYQNALLLHLYRHQGQFCTTDSCARAIWGREYNPGMDADALHRHISNIRKRLREIDPDNDLIHSERERGYKLDLTS